MELIVDRFEGKYIIVEYESGKTAEISKTLLPDAKEGDVIEISINKSKTEMRKRNIENRFNNLFDD